MVRSLLCSAAAALAALALFGASARAQDPPPGAFDLRLLQLSTSPRSLIVTELPTIAGHLTFTGSVFASYAGGTLFEAHPLGLAPVRVSEAVPGKVRVNGPRPV